MLFLAHRENSALCLIVFFTYVSYFDSSSCHCFVDRACGDTKWIPHGTVLADWYHLVTEHTRKQTELSFTTGQRSLTGPDNS